MRDKNLREIFKGKHSGETFHWGKPTQSGFSLFVCWCVFYHCSYIQNFPLYIIEPEFGVSAVFSSSIQLGPDHDQLTDFMRHFVKEDSDSGGDTGKRAVDKWHADCDTIGNVVYDITNQYQYHQGVQTCIDRVENEGNSSISYWMAAISQKKNYILTDDCKSPKVFFLKLKLLVN